MICPHGHTSQADDFCDTCGTRIDPQQQPDPDAGSAGPSEPATPEAPPAPAAPTSQVCPNCSTSNLPDALFCEACGYDFTTGALPRGAVRVEAEPPEAPPSAVAATGPLPPVSPPLPTPTGAESGAAGATGAASPSLQWVAEMWVDPDWYAGQEAEEPMPSPGLPTVVPLTLRSNLVGRVSASRSIRPDLDCTADTGVSRRHAQLTSDGSRWFVEDLGSANGTYVAPASGPLPVDPIAVGPRTELDADDRVYVGAWTRIVVRRATPEEQDEARAV